MPSHSCSFNGSMPGFSICESILYCRGDQGEVMFFIPTRKMLFWVNKIDKILHPNKTPVHLRWSWHWFSLTENFWTWLSETRSRGGARRAAQFFFWKPRKTWIFRFLARKAGKICSKFFIAFGRKKTLKNFAPKKRILTKFWKNIEKMLTKSGVFIVRLQFEWMNVSKSVGNS